MAAAFVLTATVVAACTGEPCAEPRRTMEKRIAEACNPDAGGLVSSRFCTKCVSAGFPSYEKVSGKCICGQLAFGGACISVTDDERVRAAVAFADTDCSEFFLPTEDAGVVPEQPEGDAAQGSDGGRTPDGEVDGSADAKVEDATNGG
jgi:hypothetical protein